MSRRAVCEKHKHGSVRGALRNGGAYSTGWGGEVGENRAALLKLAPMVHLPLAGRMARLSQINHFHHASRQET